jgi:alpha-1,2-mannosyltransferase
VLVPLAVVALAGLLCSPIAWDHHWAWVVVLAFALVELWTWTRTAAVLGGVLVLATAVQNPKWLDAAQQAGTLTWVQRYLVTNVWVFLAYALLGTLVVVSLVRPRARTGTPS